MPTTWTASLTFSKNRSFSLLLHAAFLNSHIHMGFVTLSLPAWRLFHILDIVCFSHNTRFTDTFSQQYHVCFTPSSVVHRRGQGRIMFPTFSASAFTDGLHATNNRAHGGMPLHSHTIHAYTHIHINAFTRRIFWIRKNVLPPINMSVTVLTMENGWIVLDRRILRLQTIPHLPPLPLLSWQGVHSTYSHHATTTSTIYHRQ